MNRSEFNGLVDEKLETLVEVENHKELEKEIGKQLFADTANGSVDWLTSLIPNVTLNIGQYSKGGNLVNISILLNNTNSASIPANSNLLLIDSLSEFMTKNFTNSFVCGFYSDGGVVNGAVGIICQFTGYIKNINEIPAKSGVWFTLTYRTAE